MSALFNSALNLLLGFTISILVLEFLNAFLALETSLANISESMSAIDSLSKAVSDLANSPSEGEIKLSKANSKGVKKVSAREERVIAFSKRSK